MLVTLVTRITVTLPIKKVLNLFFYGFFKLLSSRLQYGGIEFDWFVLAFTPFLNRSMDHY